jgi:CheY-like chemotaxis protein
VERAEAEQPDVILLDLMMPDMDGRQVRQALLERERTRGIPVVILTSQALDDEERAALQQQVFAILSKQDLSRATVAPAVQAAAQSRDGGSRPPGVPGLPL